MKLPKLSRRTIYNLANEREYQLARHAYWAGRAVASVKSRDLVGVRRYLAAIARDAWQRYEESGI